MKMYILAVSDAGCVRDNNEDMVLVGDYIFRNDSYSITVDPAQTGSRFLVAVSDGMGGHRAGEVASEKVLCQMVESIENLDSDLPEEVLFDSIRECAERIHAGLIGESDTDAGKSMGATLIGLLFYNDTAYCLNAGDSRLYRFRNGFLKQLSEDHTMSEATGRSDIDSSILINSFGGGEDVFLDCSSAGGRLLEDDIFLLCSDGLSDMLTDEQIEQILISQPGNSLDRLLNAAKEKGGEDNISIVLVKVFGF